MFNMTRMSFIILPEDTELIYMNANLDVVKFLTVRLKDQDTTKECIPYGGNSSRNS